MFSNEFYNLILLGIPIGAAQRAEAKALDEKAKREEEGQIAINAEEAAIATAEGLAATKAWEDLPDRSDLPPKL